MHVGDAVAVNGGRQTDVDIECKRTGDLVGQISAQRASCRVGSPDEFGLIPANRDGVIAVARARRPRGFLAREDG